MASDADFEQAIPIFSAHELLEDEANTLLFSGSCLTSLGATLILLNLCHIHGTSNLFISNLFTILSSSMLLAVNNLPMNEYLASKRLKQLGLDYEAIYVCPNSCMLFYREGKSNLEACTECKALRFREWVIARCL